MSILDMVQQQLGGGAIQQISQQIGADPTQTQNAINMALPVIVGGLAQNAQQPGGADALHQALDQHTGTLDQIQNALGGGGGGSMGGLAGMAANAMSGLGGGSGGGGGGMMGGLGGLLTGALGGGILSHVLGGKQAQAQDGIARQTGMNGQQVGKLLMILAPIVMGVLARRKQQDGLDSGGLTQVLQQDHQRVQQQAAQPNSPLGGILGQIFGKHG